MKKGVKIAFKISLGILILIGLFVYNLLPKLELKANSDEFRLSYANPFSDIPSAYWMNCTRSQTAKEYVCGNEFLEINLYSGEVSCKNGDRPEYIKLPHILSIVRGYNREAIVCGNQYAITDFHPAEGRIYYGPFNLNTGSFLRDSIQENQEAELVVRGNDLNLKYSDPKEEAPLEEEIDHELVHEIFFNEESKVRSKKTCKNGELAEVRSFFYTQCPPDIDCGGRSRSALICGDQYVVSDLNLAFGYTYYGPYDLK